MQTGGK